MVAVTSGTLDTNLEFKNAGALFRLQLKDNGVGNSTSTKVVFSAEANLTGKATITASDTSLPTVNVTEGAKTIELDCGTGSNGQAAKEQESKDKQQQPKENFKSKNHGRGIYLMLRQKESFNCCISRSRYLKSLPLSN